MTPTLATALNCNETIDGGLQAIFKLVENDFLAVNQLIPEQLTSDVPLIGEIGKYIVESGGKRLRPLIVLLTVPLGFIGVVLMLFLTGTHLSIMAFMGIIMMVGQQEQGIQLVVWFR